MIVPCMVRNKVNMNIKSFFFPKRLSFFLPGFCIYIFPEIKTWEYSSNFQQTYTSLYVEVARDCLSVKCIIGIALSCLRMNHSSKVRFTIVDFSILCILKGLAEFLHQARISNLNDFTSFNSIQQTSCIYTAKKCNCFGFQS